MYIAGILLCGIPQRLYVEWMKFDNVAEFLNSTAVAFVVNLQCIVYSVGRLN